MSAREEVAIMANTERKNFVVSVTEKNRGFAIIKAASKDEAEEMALEVYNEGNFHWTDSSLSEFEAQEDAAHSPSVQGGTDK
jgi:hypothetical protein